MSKTIAILAPSCVPFQVGGSEKFWWGLRNALTEWSGAFTELIKIPSREDSYLEIVDTYELFSKLNLNHFDILISTKYPAWMAHHPNHVCYMQHTLRGLYDTYSLTGLPAKVINPPAPLHDLLSLIRKPEPDRSDLPQAFELCRYVTTIKSLPSSLFSFPGPLIREIVHFFDRIALGKGEISAYLAISQTVARRPDYLPENINLKILPHPSDMVASQPRKREYFFTASRLNSSKRVRLLIDAMTRVSANISLKIAGTGPEEELLKSLAANDQRIQFLGHVPDREMPDHYADALAVPFVPYEEDYGLITIEAMKSGKPVITVSDSGGVCEFVRHEETGLVADPFPNSLGAALNRLALNPDLAEQMGRKARESVEFINWRSNIQELLDHLESEKNAHFAAPGVLVLAPFSADAQGPGGPRRLYNFCCKLASRFEVVLICIGAQAQRHIERRELMAHFNQISIPWNEMALADVTTLASLTGESSDDMALMRHAAEDEILQAAIREESGKAMCAILSHPWLYEAAAKSLSDIPLVYDAHNVEADLKTMIFGDSEIARAVADLEKRVCARASLIFACSKEDMNRFSEFYGVDASKLRLLPNGCDIKSGFLERGQMRKRLPYKDARLALFIGSDHKPNVDAAFAIFKMAEKLPEVEFLLAGSICSPDRIKKAIRPGNVHLLGIVSEKTKDALLQAADVSLNPVTSGSGVNLKSMEYLASGLPLISTSTGMRGLPHDLEPVAQICDLEQFPQRIRSFFSNPPDAKIIRETGRRFAREYCWDSMLDSLVSEIDSLAATEEDPCAC